MRILTLALVIWAAAWLCQHHEPTMQEKADAECVATAGYGYHAVNVGVYIKGVQMTHGTWCSL